MKGIKPLTRNQKEAVASYGLNWKDWGFIEDIIDEKGRPTAYFRIQHKKKNTVRLIDRFRKGVRR